MTPVSSEDEAADGDGGDNAGEVGYQAGRDGVAGAADGDGAEVDGEHVEGGFGAAHDGASHAGEEAVRAVGGDEFGKDAETPATAQRAHESHGQEFGGEADNLENRIERAADQVDATGAAEHADGHKDGDEERYDAQGDLHTFLRALDKLFVDRNPAEDGIEGKKREQEWNGEEGNGGDVGREPTTVAVVALPSGAPEEEKEKDAEGGEDETRPEGEGDWGCGGDRFGGRGYFGLFAASSVGLTGGSW